MTFDLTLRLTLALACLIIAGSIACLPLYRWQPRAFFGSALWTKIIWWVPIFLVFIALCYGGRWVAVPLVALLAFQAFREYRRQATHAPLVSAYLCFFIVATTSIAALWYVASRPVPLLIILCFSSVLSDVCAFFMGTYLSRHKLPAWLNERKSWEGVAGQIIGAPIGASIAWLATGNSAAWYIILVIGFASAIGDLFNSAAKRQLGIKDWGQTIPGHGGVLDRMSSLSTAFLAITLIVALS